MTSTAVLAEQASILEEAAEFLAKMAAAKPISSPYTVEVANYAAALDPDNWLAEFTLGRCALDREQWEEAKSHFTNSWLQHESVECAINLSVAHDQLGWVNSALGWVDKAISIDPKNIHAWLQLYGLERQKKDGNPSAAIILGLNELPDHHSLLFGRAELELMAGDYTRGLQDYEYRTTRLQLLKMTDEYPEWQGESLEGKRILVCREQGLGDCIMFARYLPLLKQLGAKEVILHTYSELARLLTPFADRVITADIDVPEFDCWIADGSLPLRMADKYDGFSARSPRYLSANPKRVEDFQEIMGPKTSKLRVGLCWQGSKVHPGDRFRSFSFRELEPLLDTPGCEFFSLQMSIEDESGLLNLSEYTQDVADLAAAIEALDVVVTCDTATLHVAGALGKTTIALIGTPCDWRWGQDSVSTPWYDSVSLVRCKDPKRWDWPVQYAKELLAGLVRSVNGSEVGGAAAIESNQSAEGRVPSPEHTERSVVAQAPATGSFEYARLWHAAKNRKADETSLDLHPRQFSFIMNGDCRYGNMYWPKNDHYIGRALDLYGEYSQSEVELLAQFLKPGDSVLDIGANVGGLTLPIAQMVGSTGRVYAIEPQPLYYGCLQANAKPFKQITSQEYALGAECSRITLRHVEETKRHAPGWAALGPEFKCQIHAIDDIGLLATCALIKIDVDGQELDILRGGEKLIDRCRPVLFVEYDKPECYPDMLPWLDEHGYKIYEHHGRLFNPDNFRKNPVNVFANIVSAMLLCVPKERYGYAEKLKGDLKRLRLTRNQ